MSRLNSRPSRKELQEARARRVAKVNESKCNQEKENLNYERFLKEIERGKYAMERNEADEVLRNLESTGKDRYYRENPWIDNITMWLEYCFDNGITFSTREDELDHIIAFVTNGNNDNNESSDNEFDEFNEFIEYVRMYIGMRNIIKDIQKDVSSINNSIVKLDEMIRSNENIIQKLKCIF
jgi:hypothetical protein